MFMATGVLSEEWWEDSIGAQIGLLRVIRSGKNKKPKDQKKRKQKKVSRGSMKRHKRR